MSTPRDGAQIGKKPHGAGHRVDLRVPVGIVLRVAAHDHPVPVHVGTHPVRVEHETEIRFLGRRDRHETGHVVHSQQFADLIENVVKLGVGHDLEATFCVRKVQCVLRGMSKHHHHHPPQQPASVPAAAAPAPTVVPPPAPAPAPVPVENDPDLHPAPTEHVVKDGVKGDDLLMQKKDRPEKPELHQDELSKDVSFEEADRLPRNDADHPDSGVHPVAGVEQKPFEDLSAPATTDDGQPTKQNSASDGEAEVKPDIKQPVDHFETYQEAHESAVNRPLMSHEHEQQDSRVDAARLNPDKPLPPSPNAGNLGSGSNIATGNPAEFGQDDKAALRAHAVKDVTHPGHDRAVKETAAAEASAGHGHAHAHKPAAPATDKPDDKDNPHTPPRVASVNEPGTSAGH